MMKNLIHFILLCCCLVALVPRPTMSAKRQQNTQQICSGIEGRITTEDGALIPRVNIRLVNKATKQNASVQTNGEGEYTVCLTTGAYDVFADAEGFKPMKRKSVKVETSAKSTIDFVMKRGKPVIVDGAHP